MESLTGPAIVKRSIVTALFIGLAIAGPLPNAAQVPSQLGQWSAPFSLPLVAVHAILLRTGQVLMWDAFARGPNAFLWDPTTGATTSVQNQLANPFCAGHVTLADGRVMVIGGHLQAAFNGVNDTSLFDPQSQTWSLGPFMTYGRWYPSTTTLSDGRILVVSGATTANCPTCVADIPELFDPATNSWTQLAAARITMPLYPFMFQLPDGRVLWAGADADNTDTNVLDVATQTWTSVDPRIIPGGSAVMYRPGRVLKAGSPAEPGLTPIAPSLKTAYVIDMSQASPAWRQVGSMAFGRTYHTLTVLPDGTVLATGGIQTTDETTTQAALAAELWDPQTEQWTTLSSGRVIRSYHSTGLLLPDGRVLVAGSGGCCSVTDQFNGEIFSPPYLFKGARPTITSAPSVIGYGTGFSVQTPDSASIASVALIRLGAVTHAYDQEQRYVPLTFTRATGALNVTAPVNGALAPPGQYMLFIVNSSGVPSVAAIVQVRTVVGGPPPGGSDTTPPTISMTAPAAGATVSGTVTVSASANDNVGVAGVQFLLDGSPLGAELDSAPYNISWATTGVVNGTHQLSARARDAAGNTAVATAVTVTVSNAGVQLMAAYALNEGTGTVATDASGAGRNGTLVNGPAWVAGHTGSALSFDGVNDYVEVAGLPYLAQWTISGWVRSPAAPTSGAASGPIHRDANFQINWNHTNPVFQGAAGLNVGGNWYAASFGALAANTWYYLAATYDGQTLTTYTNGVLAAKNTIPAGASTVESNPLRLGAHAALPQFFQGIVDDVRIYNGAITQSQVQQDMQTPVGTTPGGPPPPADTTPPNVSMTAPAAGATVSGTVTVSASATDNVGVAGVQFLLDGNALGAEVTQPPYNSSWSTTGAPNGTHQLSARARDGAGNTAVATAITVTVSNTAPSGGLMAAYALDDGTGAVARDSSGAARDGTLINGPAWVAGHTGSALSFNGVNNYVDVTTLPYLAQWTISAWVRSPAAPAATAASGPIHREANFQINWNHPDPTFRGAAGLNVGGTWYSASFGTLPANTWIYLAATYDGETLNTYTNGVLVNSNAAPSGPSANEPNPLRLGRHAALPNFFQGIVDDVRIYDHALTVGQVQQDMQTPVGSASGGGQPPGSDTTPPTVSMTAPAAGATVSGTVTVSASATDNVGVAGVQFLLDGNALGPEVTAAPYNFSWTTTGTANGTHQLSARARDAAGNSTTATAITVTVSNAAPSGGLVAAYALDEGSGTVATDSSGAGRNGTLVNGPAWVAGHTGSALSFNGVNNYVDVTTLPYLAQWTISAWVRSPAAPAATAASGPIHREANFQINWNHPNPAFQGAAALNVGGTWYSASFGTLPANTWIYLAATYNGETLNAYTNGVLMTSNTAPSGPSANDPNPLRLGRHAALTNFFQGIVDDVRVYDHALTLSQVQQDMQTPVGGASGGGPPPGSDTTPPTVSMTAPAAGATVSGTVTVSASATDNVGVAGVQFLLDGAALGAEVTTAPYSISWATTGTANGSHQLSARARDGAGNTTTATAITVTVSNTATSGLMAAYSLNEGIGTVATDSSGAGRNGTLVNGPTWVAGHTGNALSFDGVNDYVEVASLPYLAQWTISAWVRSPAAPAAAAASGPIHREGNFQINWNHPDPAFRGAAAVNVGGTWYSASFGTLAANTWNYLVATYDGETLNAYTNGVLMTSNTAPSGPSATEPNPMRLGGHATLPQFFQGIIDDVRVYDHALTLNQVQQDMQTPVGP